MNTEFAFLRADASESHWGIIVTQILTEDLDLDLDVLIRGHEPLAFLSGTFNRSEV